MANEALKPCPFCGSSPRVARKSGVTGVACRSRYYRETVVCKCGASSKEHKAPGRAVEAWNRRATLSSEQARDALTELDQLQRRAEKAEAELSDWKNGWTNSVRAHAAALSRAADAEARVAELVKADETRARDISRLMVERDTARDRVVELEKALEPFDGALDDEGNPDEIAKPDNLTIHIRAGTSRMATSEPPAAFAKEVRSMVGRTLIERLNIPWPDHETEEVTLPAWVLELCAEGAARITALEAQLAERVKAAYLKGRSEWAPAGVLSDNERTERDWQSALSALESTPPVPKVKVKMLEWRRHPAGGEQALAAGLGMYRVHENGDDWYLVPDHMGTGGKAAAQADYERRILSALETAPPAPKVTATHRHKKRGTEYVLLGIGKMQAEWWVDTGQTHTPFVDMREVAIYRSVDGGALWVRPREEFEDGRFEALTAAQES